MDERRELLPPEVVLGDGPDVLNRVQLGAVGNVKYGGHAALLKVLLHHLTVVNSAVVEEEGHLASIVLGKDCFNVLDEALRVDRLGLGDESLQAILGRDPSQHRDSA